MGIKEFILGMKTKDKMKIIGALLFLCLIILGFLFVRVVKENNICKANPFVYGAIRTAEEGMEIICSCTPFDLKYAGFCFDKNEIFVGRCIGSGNFTLP